MNIAFSLVSSKAWRGGFNYLLNLLTSLSCYESHRIHPFVFCGIDASNSDVAAFEAIDGVVVIRSHIFNAENRRRALLWSLFTAPVVRKCTSVMSGGVGLTFSRAATSF